MGDRLSNTQNNLSDARDKHDAAEELALSWVNHENWQNPEDAAKILADKIRAYGEGCANRAIDASFDFWAAGYSDGRRAGIERAIELATKYDEYFYVYGEAPRRAGGERVSKDIFHDRTTNTFGPAYEVEKDAKRIGKQYERIRDLMLSVDWKTLREIADITGDPEASISAQLRHLRKEKFGGYTLEKRRRSDRGTWEYRLRAHTTPTPAHSDTSE